MTTAETTIPQDSPPASGTANSDAGEKFGPIRKGLLEFVILRVINLEKLYVAEMLQRLSGTEFSTQEGTLYPLLSRMRRDNLVDYEWQESEAGPPRKYYRLTEPGRQALAELQGYWQHLNETINRLGN
jgi:PadR family transcriptional regulator, regulatory protein PadR